jgi:two-component SAPR family response regulator
MQASSPNPLQGRRILIVEDEMLVALALEDLLILHGVEVLGPVSTVPRALKFLKSNRPDCVTLDMNLKGELSIPVAEDLSKRAIPFVIVSGYVQSYPETPDIRAAPFVRKPFVEDDLIAVLHSILN